jgi:hypothetical protein
MMNWSNSSFAIISKQCQHSLFLSLLWKEGCEVIGEFEGKATDNPRYLIHVLMNNY